MSSISAGTSAGSALVSAGDTTGDLILQVNGTTPSVSLKANGSIGLGSTPSYGTSGQVLTSGGSGASPTWTTLGSGALTFISSTTISNGVTAVDITSGFTTTYDQYLIIVDTLANTNNYLLMQYYIDGSLVNTGTPAFSNLVTASQTGSASAFAANNSYMYIGGYGSQINCVVTLSQTHSSGANTYTSTYFGRGGGSYYGGSGGGVYTGTFTTGVTGIRIFNNNGNSFTGGIIKLYGYQKT